MRIPAVVLLACTLVSAQEDKSLFDPPGPEELVPGSAPGAVVRYAESLHRTKEHLGKEPYGAAPWKRLFELCVDLERSEQLVKHLEPIVTKSLPDKPEDALALRRTYGWALVQNARRYDAGVRRGNIFVFRGGGNPKELREKAIPHLRVAVAADPKDLKSRVDLEESLARTDRTKHAEEITRLKAEIEALRPPKPPAAPAKQDQNQVRAVSLRLSASQLEIGEEPDHARALSQRQAALVHEFCRETFDLGKEVEGLFAAVSRLAKNALVTRYLTRTYKNRDGAVKSVPPVVHVASAAKKAEVLRELATLEGRGTAAVLLAYVRRADAPGVASDIALPILAKSGPAPVKEHLPALLETALRSEDDNRFPRFGRRMLVQLAGLLSLEEAKGRLLAVLSEDRDLNTPLDAARALGRLVKKEDEQAKTKLLEIASDKNRDLYFRRAAVDALGRIDPVLVAPFADDPDFALAVAAARYRAAPEETAKGRLLNGLRETYAADEAAEYCLELGIAEAVPLLRGILSDRRDFAAPYLQSLLDKAGAGE